MMQRLSIDQHDTASIDYEAPLLATSEIIDCLQELGLEVTHDDLVHPAPERLRLLYTILLQLLFDVDDTQQENDQKSNDDADLDSGKLPLETDMVTTKELVAEITLFDKISLFLTRLGYQDFRFNDLAHPTPLRVAKSLSTIINYIKSCDQSWQEFATLASQEENILLETQKQQDEIHEIMHRNKEKQYKRDNLEPPLPVLEAQLEQLEQSLPPLEQSLERVSDELARVKLTRQTLKDTLQSHQYNTLTMVNDAKALKRRSDIDYPMLLSKIKTTEKKIGQLEAATTSEKQQLEALTNTMDCQSQAFDFISKAYALKAEMIQGWADIDQLNTINNDLKDKIHDIDIKLNKMEYEEKSIQTKIKEIDTAYTDLQAQMNKKREMISIHMAKLQDDHNKTIQEVTATNQQKHECLEMNHRMVLEAQQVKDHYTNYVAKRSSDLHHLKEMLCSLSDRVDDLTSEHTGSGHGGPEHSESDHSGPG